MSAFSKMVRRFEEVEKATLAAVLIPENRNRVARTWEKKFDQLLAAYAALDIRENVDGSFSPRQAGDDNLQADMAWEEVME